MVSMKCWGALEKLFERSISLNSFFACIGLVRSA